MPPPAAWLFTKKPLPSHKNKPGYISATASAMIRRGEQDRAITLLEEGVAKFPDDALMHGQLGRTYATVSERLQQPPRAWSSEADAYRLKAAAHIMRASDLAPDDYRFACNAGIQCALINDVPRAIAYYSRAAQLQTQDAYPWQKLGELHLHRGDNQTAVICFQNAVRLNPRTPVATRHLVDLGYPAAAIGEVDLRPMTAVPPARRFVGPRLQRQ